MRWGEQIYKTDKKFVFGALFLLGLIAVIYNTTFVWLYERYTYVDSYYSHGFLVPFISGFLIWSKRKELKDIRREFSCMGLVLVIFSLILHFLSSLAEVFFVSGFSILFLAFGISLFLFGKEITKKILFPLSFLIFMFPLPIVAINAISFPMKMFVTKSAVFILETFTPISVRNEGFQIFFSNGSLTIGNPCSGLRSLIVMLALGSIFAYFLKAGAAKKVLLFLSAVPIAIISNMLRVILLCFAVYIYGNKIVEGFLHDFTGYLVFIFAFFGLWVVWRGLQKDILK